MANAIVVDYDIFPAICRKLEEFGIEAKTVIVKEMMKELQTRPHHYNLLMAHCPALDSIEFRGDILTQEKRVITEIKELQPGIVIVGFSPCSSDSMKHVLKEGYKEFLSLSEDLYEKGIERVLRKYHLI